ncbi:hypothetical protein CC79DRAFT_1321895 [Sarocladium strictum]
MLRDALKSLVGAEDKPPSYQQHHFYPPPGPPTGDNYGYPVPGPPGGTGPHDYVAAAQAMIDLGKKQDEEWGGRFGDYHEKRARKKADKMFGPMIAASYGGEGSGPSPAQIMIDQGKSTDKEYGYKYGDYYEKRAAKKARKLGLM